MDKVIIDDIDVSECDNLAILQDRMTDKEFTFCNAYQEDCSERENCHYKQLQRLKHQYADVLKLAKENADSNEYCLQELEQENEELKTLKDMYFTYYKAKHNDVKGEFFTIKKENERLKEESDKLKQVLRDIRECATTEMVEIATRKDYNGFLALQGISAKIKEVIGAE